MIHNIRRRHGMGGEDIPPVIIGSRSSHWAEWGTDG